MRSGLSILLLIAIAFGTGYWFYTANAVCKVPIAYRIGSIDPDFNISLVEAKAAASGAESLWEDATGRNLFTYDEGAEFAINFIYDERQQASNEEQNLREELENREWKSDSVKKQYERLLDEYEDLKEAYEERTEDYEAKLRAHNAEVERWNEAGGAPEDIYKNLSRKQEELKEEQDSLNSVAYELNQLVKRMNAIGAEGNSLIEGYNEIVEEYNSRFSENTEFTQGDYQGDSIHIYQFDSTEDLKIVLAHEFGHALSLGHVEGAESIMYHFMKAQSLGEGITDSDLEEFEQVCGDDRRTLFGVL